jgi:hypothetical protein
MKHFALAFACLAAAAALPGAALGREPAGKSPPLSCETGPVVKTFGMTSWLVFSCDDGRSVVIVSAPGNPAMPFVFTLSPAGAGYRLSGEGTGRREATKPAFDALKTLSTAQIMALIEETRQRR